VKTLLNGRRGEAYNIGNSDNEIAMRDLANLYTKLVPDCTVSLISYPDTYPAGEPQRRCPDLRKAAKELGYGSRVDLKTGLTRFIDWARTQTSYRGPPDA
jgi:UDP-glucuronate decarboxylase